MATMAKSSGTSSLARIRVLTSPIERCKKFAKRKISEPDKTLCESEANWGYRYLEALSLGMSAYLEKTASI